MAYVKVKGTRTAIAALRYGEHEMGVVRSGVDCPDNTETAARLFRADRIQWDKEDGVQAQTIIQSFEGSEVTKEQANKLGQELARRIAPGHRAMIYTHSESEGGHIHNHIVINSVNYKTGERFNSHGFLWTARRISNEISLENGLSVITPGQKAALRYTQAEQGMVSKQETPWKDEIRGFIEYAKSLSTLEDFKTYLAAKGVTINERLRKRDSTISWTYIYQGSKKVRAAKLGDQYSRDSVCDGFARSVDARPVAEIIGVAKARMDEEKAALAEEEAKKAAAAAAAEAAEKAEAFAKAEAARKAAAAAEATRKPKKREKEERGWGR